MLLSKPQTLKFWREWAAVVHDNHWNKTRAETERHALLARAGFNSLTEVDHLNGFSQVLKELAILREDLAAMLRADNNPKRVLIFKIHHLANQIAPATKNGTNPYLGGIMLDQFGHLRLDDLTEQQLTNLRNTLTARLHSRRLFLECAGPPALSSTEPF